MIVYGVYTNVDMTEGRGPMMLDQLFLNKEKAITYMDHQLGIMGRHFSKFTNPKTGQPYKSWTEFGVGEWQLRELDMIE